MMNTIDALTLSKATAETFSNFFETSDKLAIKFFGNVVGYISKESDSDCYIEISLPELCRKSKRQLQAELMHVKKIKVVSGQHNKKVVGYLTAA